MLRWITLLLLVCWLGIMVVAIPQPRAGGEIRPQIIEEPWQVGVSEPPEFGCVSEHNLSLLAEIEFLPRREQARRIFDDYRSCSDWEDDPEALPYLFSLGPAGTPVLLEILRNDLVFDRESDLVHGVLDHLRSLGPPAIVELARLHDEVWSWG